MSLILQSDTFSRSGAIGSNWSETLLPYYTSFILNGSEAEPSPTLILNPGAGNWIPPNHRAIFNPFDPKASVSPVVNGTEVIFEYSCKIVMPDPLPSAGQVLRLGIMGLCALDPNDFQATHVSYVIDSSGTHYLRLIFVDSAGNQNIVLPVQQDLTTRGVALAAGESAVLNLYVRAAGPNFITYRMSWSREPGFWSWNTPQNINSSEGHGGIFCTQGGPFTNTITPIGVGFDVQGFLSATARIDNFRVIDGRALALRDFFPRPTLVAEPTYSDVLLPVEANSGGTITPNPTFVIPGEVVAPIREHKATDGHTSTHPGYTNQRRKYTLSWVGLSESEKDNLWAQFEDAEGTLKDLRWTRHGVTKSVRCLTSPSKTRDSVGTWTINAEVIEIL